MTTITIRFDADDLPEWARAVPAVVRRCRVDLGFRASVYQATTRQLQRHLIGETRRLERIAANN